MSVCLNRILSSKQNSDKRISTILRSYMSKKRKTEKQITSYILFFPSHTLSAMNSHRASIYSKAWRESLSLHRPALFQLVKLNQDEQTKTSSSRLLICTSLTNVIPYGAASVHSKANAFHSPALHISCQYLSYIFSQNPLPKEDQLYLVAAFLDLLFTIFFQILKVKVILLISYPIYCTQINHCVCYL